MHSYSLLLWNHVVLTTKVWPATYDLWITDFFKVYITNFYHTVLGPRPHNPFRYNLEKLVSLQYFYILPQFRFLFISVNSTYRTKIIWKWLIRQRKSYHLDGKRDLAGPQVTNEPKFIVSTRLLTHTEIH